MSRTAFTRVSPDLYRHTATGIQIVRDNALRWQPIDTNNVKIGTARKRLTDVQSAVIRHIQGA